MFYYLCNDCKYYSDTEGYLQSFQDWNKQLAIKIAKHEDIILTEIHWQIIDFMREFYVQHQIHPSTKIIMRRMVYELGMDKNSTYLFKLFPQGLAKQAVKIAGLPKPIVCL